MRKSRRVAHHAQGRRQATIHARVVGAIWTRVNIRNSGGRRAASDVPRARGGHDVSAMGRAGQWFHRVV
jgi:hypothetical protein